MSATRTTYTVRGTLQGSLWWPVGAPASKTFEYCAQRSGGRRERDLTLAEYRAIDAATFYADGRLTLRELAEAAMSAEDGDFSGDVRMLADTTLTVTRWRADGRGHTSRSFDLARFPCLADYTSAEWPAWEDES